MGEAERGDTAPRFRISYWCANGHETAPRFRISYWCANGHETTPSFSEEVGVQPPEVWDCPRCGFPAGQDQMTPPSPPRNEPYKTHLAYVKERRSDADGKAILDEALQSLRARKIIR